MTTSRVRLPVLPLRKWLVLTLAITFFVPVLATATIVAHVLSDPSDTTEVVADRLRSDAAQWSDPAWLAVTRADLGALGVEFVLVEDGREIYRSTADPLATASEDANRLVRTIEIPGSDPASHQTAYAYADQNEWGGFGPPSQRRPFWLVPIVAMGSLLLTVGGIGWFLGRMVVRPLAATNSAAHDVAAGNLDIELPTSRVREVAELNASFASMSTELRASLHHQAALEQERRLFIAAVVHDLRTPLFALRGYLEGLEKGVADTPEKQSHYVATAQEKATALERLVTDLFDYTRLEYLDQIPDREPLDLDALLRRLTNGLQPRAEAKRITLTLDQPPHPCIVDGDSHLLTRAVENLLDNAVRYTPSGGSVRVACVGTSDAARFTIADTGPGIPAHDLPHLFTPLYRGETSRNRRTGGAGLGLTIARRILRAHGGDLIAANNPDGGAVFTGTLPSPAPESSRGQVAPARDSPALTPRR